MKSSEYGHNFIAIFFSIVIHAGLLGLLLWNTDFTELVSIEPSNSAPSQPTMEAVMVDQSAIKAQADKIREKREEAKLKEEERLKKIEEQALLIEKQRQEEEQRLKDIQAQKLAAEKAAREAELERKRIAEEQRKIQEATRLAEEKAKEAEAKRLQQLADAKKAEEAAKRAEEAARKAAEAAKIAEQERQEAERKAAEAERQMAEAERLKAEQEAALNDLFRDLESESLDRNSAREQLVKSEVDRYSAMYTVMISSKFNKDNIPVGETCRIRLRLARDGFVIEVTPVAGNDLVCHQAVNAVTALRKFPISEDPSAMEKLRDIYLTFQG